MLLASQQQSVTAFDPERLKSILNFVPALIAYLNTNLVYEYVNRNYELFIGKPQEDIIGKSISEVHGERMLQRIQLHLQKALKGEPVSYHNSILDKNGSEKIVKVQLMPERNLQGEVIGIVAMAEDITQQAQMKKEADQSANALEKQRKILHDLFMNAPGPVALLSGPELKFELVNPEVEKTVRRKIELGSLFREVLPEIAAQGIEDELLKALQDLKPVEAHEVEIILPNAEGEIESHYFDYTFQPYMNEKDEPEGIAVFANDVTEKVLGKSVLEERSGRQKVMVESIPQMAWTTMTDGVLDYHNQRWFDYTGMSIDEVREKGWHPIVHLDDFLPLRKKWEQARAKKEMYEFELRLKNAADDTYYWHLLRSTPVKNEQGEIYMWVGTATNIHDQITFQQKLKQSQEQLEKMVQERTAEINSANQELIKTNNELNRFAYVISHDLKAPLRGISSLASWLYEDYQDKLGEEGKEQLDLLMQRVKRMHDLIEGILQYSRAGRDMDEERKKVSLKKVLNEVIGNLTVPKHITITIADNLPELEFQETKIYQVFQNLISNALKFNDKPEGKIEVNFEEEKKEYLFSVKDNGTGISENYFDRIFQLFQTLDSQGNSESTGVGLAIVKKIIEAAGGKVWVESEEGEGATFFFAILKDQPRKPVENSRE